MNPLNNIRIVLVEPIYGGNIGSVCRAMMNMGLSRLDLVRPRPDIDMNELRQMSYHAYPIYEDRREFDRAPDAVADCGLVAATTARVGFYRDHAQSPREWAPRLLEAALDTPVAVLFGPEDRGLSNDEIALATQIVQIPSAPEYTSLNLAQAVMVCAYELYAASGQFEPSEERFPEAPSELRERMFALWEQVLLRTGFMKEDKAPHMMMGLRRILSRGPLTIGDIKILMGIAKQTQWVCEQLEQRPDR